MIADYRAVIAAVAGELRYLDPARILVVAASARRESAASIRGFGGESAAYVKPRITIGGARQLYEIALRPKFFRSLDARARREVFVHELWHIAPAFDGTLASDRRHSGPRIEPEVIDLASRIPRELFEYRGELRVDAWLARPPSREPRNTRARLDYDERDLFTSLVEQT